MAKSKNPAQNGEKGPAEASLVPLYSPLDVTRGIQAYRRGDVILYTVRGEPSKVQELVGELGRRGVSEVVALVSHAAPEAEPDLEDVPEDVEEADPKDD